MMYQTADDTIHNMATGQTYRFETIAPSGYSKSTELYHRVITGRDALKITLASGDNAHKLWQDLVEMCARYEVLIPKTFLSRGDYDDKE